MTVTVELTAEQQAWLEALVEAGVFPSVEDGVRVAVAELMLAARDDVSWSGDSVSEGQSVPGSIFSSRLNKRNSRLH